MITVYPHPSLALPALVTSRGYQRTITTLGALSVSEDEGERLLKFGTAAGTPAFSYTSNYWSMVVTDGGANLLGYWPLGATVGLTDLSPGAHNGVARGGVTVGGAAGPGTGALTATTFDGVDDTVTTALNPFTNATIRTYEFWARRAAHVNQHAIFGGDGSANIPQLTLSAGGQDVVWRPAGGGGSGVTWASAFPGDNIWTHGMVVFNESTDTAKLYLNGGLVSSQTTADQYQATSGNFEIGGLKQTTGSTTIPYGGQIAHVAVYNGDFSNLAGAHYLAGIQ